MAVASRSPYATATTTQLQYSSQTFRKRTHGDHIRSEDGEIDGSWKLRIEVILEPDCSDIQGANQDATNEFGEDVIVMNIRVLGDMHVGRIRDDLIRSLGLFFKLFPS